MANKLTHKGTVVSVCATAQNSDLTSTTYAALTWVPVGSVGNPGDFGATSNLPSYNTLDEAVSQKQKGVANAGDPQIEVASIYNDAGQIILRDFGDPLNIDNMAIKWERANGQEVYSRGVVTGPMYPGGGADDFVLERFTIGLNQLPITVDPT